MKNEKFSIKLGIICPEDKSETTNELIEFHILIHYITINETICVHFPPEICQKK